MSGAGRGTPRVSPVVEAPPNEGSFTNLAITEVPWNWWHAEKTLTAGQVALVGTFAAYAAGETTIPLGATRAAIVGTYTPALAGGFPVFQLNWGQFGRRGYRITDIANIVFPATDTELQSAEAPVFGEAFALPASPDTDPIEFLLPFWVPPAPKLSSVDGILLGLEVREGSANPGQIEITTLIAQNFGGAQGVARL